MMSCENKVYVSNGGLLIDRANIMFLAASTLLMKH